MVYDTNLKTDNIQQIRNKSENWIYFLMDIMDNIIVTDIGRAQFPKFQVPICT